MSNNNNLINGIWINEYGSVMTITSVEDGFFYGEYSSTTGDTGTYKVVGVYDTSPESNEQTVSFSISWRSINGSDTEDKDAFSHSCSSFSGQIQHNGADLIMPVIHILTSPHEPEDRWKNSLIDKLTYTKKEIIGGGVD